MSGDSCHAAQASSDTSTTGASPVRSRCSRPAAMPPAIVMPPGRSPNAARGAIGHSLSAGVSASATPPRAQYDAPS